MIFEVLKLGSFLQIRVLENGVSPNKSEGVVSNLKGWLFVIFSRFLMVFFIFVFVLLA